MIWNDDTEKTTGIIREKTIGMSKITYVEIVLCKDCKYWKDNCCYNRIIPCPQPNKRWFCADGERRDK